MNEDTTTTLRETRRLMITISKASTRDTNWLQNYEALKAHVLKTGHLPNKHVIENRALYWWVKYQRKKIKEGTLDAEKRELFEALLATRSNEHTGGKRKKTNKEE